MQIRVGKLIKLLKGFDETPFYKTSSIFVIDCLTSSNDSIPSLLAQNTLDNISFNDWIIDYFENIENETPDKVDAILEYLLNSKNNRVFLKNKEDLIEYIRNHIYTCSVLITNDKIIRQTNKYDCLTSEIHCKLKTIFQLGLKDTKNNGAIIIAAIQIINEKLTKIAKDKGKGDLAESKAIDAIFIKDDNPFNDNFTDNEETSQNRLDGFKSIYLGVFKAIRNPGCHNVIQYDVFEYVEIMMLLDLLLTKLDSIS